MAQVFFYPKFQAFDENGDPAVGWKLHTYTAGTVTPVATFTNESGTLNTNPIILNSRGEADVWINPALQYKFYLTDENDVEIWTKDDLGYDNMFSAIASYLTTNNYAKFQWLSFNSVSLTAPLTTGTTKFSQVMPAACTVSAVVGAVVTASSSGVVTFDINKNGTSILGNKLVIDANETSTLTAATAPTIVTTTFAAGDVLTIDYDAVGTGSAGSQIMLAVTWS